MNSGAMLDETLSEPDPPQTANPYDRVPYSSYPYPQSRPDRLALIATLFGMSPPPVDRCRVLELGCSSGGNLIPLAEAWPGSEFVGIDASTRQVDLGNELLSELGLPNVRLLHKDILDIGPEFGEFDYIIVHGVFSWVPPEVQEKILSICSANLSPSGVAYVSYNTLPGWRMRGIIRDMMKYRAGAFEEPADQIQHARQLLDFLAQSVPAEDNAYGMLLRKELNMLRDKEDHYLYHDHLEEVNEPIYFHEFMKRAAAHRLQYLGEADFGSMAIENFPPPVEAVLRSVSSGLIQLEQYMDFMRNRMFRQTLLCHKEVRLERPVALDRLMSLHVASGVRPQALVDVNSNAKAVFEGPSAVTHTTEPLVKASLLHLGEIWPRSVPFTELLATARSRLSADPVVVDTGSASMDYRRLAEPMLRCHSTGQVEFSTTSAPYTTDLAERPVAASYARRQALLGDRVTNLRHELVPLPDLPRHVLRHLDGTRDEAAVLDAIIELAAGGKLIVHENGRPCADVQRLREILSKPVAGALRQLSRQALLLDRH